MTGFEPAPPATRTRCATKLRYIPIFVFVFCSAPTVLPLLKMIFNHFSSAESSCATFRYLFLFFCSAPTVLPLLKMIFNHLSSAESSCAIILIPFVYLNVLTNSLTTLKYHFNFYYQVLIFSIESKMFRILS